MRKTTVYLEETEAEGLKRLAAESGRPQAELIREAINKLLGDAPPRKFHSMGIGASGSAEVPRWDANELYRKVMGRD